MKIRLISDLHLEISAFDLPPLPTDQETVLVIAGDVNPSKFIYANTDPSIRGIATHQTTAELFDTLVGRFKAVVYVAGNHEYYGCSMTQSDNEFRVLCNSYCDFHFLQGTSVVIDDVTFVGATLWTDFNKGNPLDYYYAGQGLNDFRCIINDYGLTEPGTLIPEVAHMIHKEHLEAIKTELDNKTTEKSVVVTHHAPHYNSVANQYRTGRVALLNHAYYSDLTDFIEEYKPDLHIHGHCHSFFDYKKGQTRILCNPRGYQSDSHQEDSGFNPNFVVEV